ncbi:hypothetical protein BDR26DRAFT_859932, partial [Obelidium mucronatum]
MYSRSRSRSLLPLFALLAASVPQVRTQTQTLPAETQTQTQTADPLSVVSVVAGVAVPGVVGLVFTISSWAAAADPCVNNCLTRAPAVDINDPKSVHSLCSDTDLINACTTSCPGNTLITALANVCATAKQQGSMAAVPEASNALSPSWFISDLWQCLLGVLL